MAAKSSDWLDEQRLARELRIHPGHEDYTLLPAYIEQAIAHVSRWTSLPLVDTYPVYYDVPFGPSDAPIIFRDTVAPVGVESVTVWETDQPDSVAGKTITTVVDGKVVPDTGLVDIRGGGTIKDVIIWPRASGWPEARRIDIKMRIGAAPADYPSIPAALILVCRDLYEGVSVAEKKPAYERILQLVALPGVA